jgi:hypothetical protein
LSIRLAEIAATPELLTQFEGDKAVNQRQESTQGRQGLFRTMSIKANNWSNGCSLVIIVLSLFGLV